MPLKVRLNAGEKIIVNGVVIQNGDRRAFLTIANQANILRGKDVMVEAQVDTAVKKLYFLIQKCLIEGQDENVEIKDQIFNLAAELYSAIERSDVSDNIFVSMDYFSSGDFYKSLAALRMVIEYEDRLINEERKNKEGLDVDAYKSADYMEFVR
jgi:flagellar protein FlbT